MIVIAVDPGLDVTGGAVYDTDRLDRQGVTIADKCGPALVEVFSLRTDPDDELGLRLGDLGDGAQAIRRRRFPCVCLVEGRAPVGGYGRMAGKERAVTDSVWQNGLAAGALIAALGAQVIRADTTPKPRKQTIGRQIIAASPCARRSNADERDAVFLGAQWMLSRPAAA